MGEQFPTQPLPPSTSAKQILFGTLAQPPYSNNASVFLQVDHQRALDRHHFAQVQLRTATQQWHRDHEQLQARALVTLEEARHAHQEELEHHRNRQHQLDVCSQLREKVCERDPRVTVLRLSDEERRRRAPCGSCGRRQSFSSLIL